MIRVTSCIEVNNICPALSLNIILLEMQHATGQLLRGTRLRIGVYNSLSPNPDTITLSLHVLGHY